MGYELDKLLKQYGVNTPSMANYAGTAIPTQVTAPVTPTFYNTKGDKVDLQFRGSATGGLIPVDTLLSTNAVTPVSGNWEFANNDDISAANKVALDKYNTAWNTYYGGNDAQRNADYQEQLRKYNLDIADYNKYKQDYQSRLASTPMYSGSQFQTTPNATQNTYATPIAAPTYGSIPLSYGSMTPEQQSAYYNAQREKGYTAADLSNAYNTALGTSPTNSSTLSDLENKYANRLDTWMPNTAYDTSNVPTNFNWQEYINANPDLGAAGIDTEKEAQRHYVLYGANENRQGYGDGGLVESQSVDPITLRYYNPQPDPMAPIEPEVSAGQTPTQVQMYDDYPNEVDMLSSKAQEPAMYQQEETVAPVTPIAAPATRSETFDKILKQYFPQTDTYNKELEDARRQAKLESDAFTKMIENSIKNPEQDNLSKAEMYFRLAAAFGSPTKTKQGFMENLGAAGQQLAEYSKGARADQAAKNALRVEAQKLKMQGAKEDLATVRALAGKEMDERKAVGLKLIEEYVKSGEAKSTAGKQAQDEGYKPGTPGFQRRTEEIGNFNIQKGLEQLGLQKQQVEIAMSNLGLKSQQQAQQNTRLSSGEMKMKLDSEKNIQSYQQAMANLDTAYRLNPNTYTGGITDWLKSVPGKWGANDPTYINTKQLENLLGSQAVEQLRATFAGSPTEGERAVLMELQGIGAKSKEERKRIILNTYKALKKRLEKETDRLQRINSREFATSDNTPDAE